MTLFRVYVAVYILFGCIPVWTGDMDELYLSEIFDLCQRQVKVTHSAAFPLKSFEVCLPVYLRYKLGCLLYKKAFYRKMLCILTRRTVICLQFYKDMFTVARLFAL